jgi:hypothetical protein
MQRIAAVTMQYNETYYLPRWISYYGSEFGRENLFVIDNDSEAEFGSAFDDVSRIRYRRTAFDDSERARFVSRFVASLLELYDTVVFTDCDEFVCPDARSQRSLRTWIEANDFEHVTCMGLNVIPDLSEEDAVLAPGPILGQRKHARLLSPMCKASVVRKPVRWGGGFHHVSRPPNFQGLFLFHMKLAHIGQLLARQALTRSMSWANLNQGVHQRVTDAVVINRILAQSKMPSVPWSEDEIDRVKRQFVEGVKQHERGGDIGCMYASPLDISSQVLMKIPEEFFGIF